MYNNVEIIEIKLMSHNIKIWENITNKRVSQLLLEIRLEFMSGRSKMEPMFCIIQIAEKYRENKRMLCVWFLLI